jgi:hypothetical protein
LAEPTITQKYERAADEIAQRRRAFIAAGAGEQVLQVFDAQNPAPERQGVDPLGYFWGGMMLGGLTGTIAGGATSLAGGATITGIGKGLTAISKIGKKKEEEENTQTV